MQIKTRRRIAGSFLVATAVAAMPFIAAAPAQAVEPSIQSDEDSVVLDSFPDAQTIQLDKFDDNGGADQLTSVKVTASVAGELEGTATNLSDSKAKTLHGEISADIDVNGVGVDDLTAAGQDTSTWNLGAGASAPIALSASDSSETTITDPDVLALFVGGGTIDYAVKGQVSVDITGPAPYKTTGVAEGKATVKIEYTYEPGQTPVCATGTPTTVPIANGSTALADGGGGEFTISNFVQLASGWSLDWTSTNATVSSVTATGTGLIDVVDELLTGVLNGPDEASNYTLTVCATSTSTPPPSCADWYKVQDGNGGDANTEGAYDLPGGGTFTISDLHDTPEGEVFDWSSTVPIYALSVKGGPVSFDDEEKYEYPGGATSDDDVHAPFNSNSGKWYGLSHLSVCLGTPTDPCVANPLDPSCSPDPCVVNPSDPSCSPDPCVVNPSDPSCSPDPCVVNPSDPSCTPPPTCETDASLCPPDTHECTDSSAPGCSPPSNQCPTSEGLKVDGGSGFAGVYALPGGGSFTVSNVHDDGAGQVFDWSSTTKILTIGVKGGNGQLVYSYPPDGALGDTGLHAPMNPSNKWAAVSHLCVIPLPAPGPIVPKPADPGKQGDETDQTRQQPAKIDKATLPQQEEADEPDPEPEPEPAPEPAPEPQSTPPAQPQEATPPPAEPKPDPQPATDPAASTGE